MNSPNILPDLVGNLRAHDRILSLEVIDGKAAKSSTGKVDTRLFTGEQKLHLQMNEQTNLWSFRYENNGLLPGGLEGQFTTFSKGLAHAEQYFAKRNIRVKEIID
jgi:hypothetical protein